MDHCKASAYGRRHGIWVGTGPHEGGTTTEPQQPDPDTVASPLNGRPHRTVPEQVMAGLRVAMYNGMASDTVKISHKVLPEPIIGLCKSGPDPARVRPIKPECFLELEAEGRT